MAPSTSEYWPATRAAIKALYQTYGVARVSLGDMVCTQPCCFEPGEVREFEQTQSDALPVHLVRKLLCAAKSRPLTAGGWKLVMPRICELLSDDQDIDVYGLGHELRTLGHLLRSCPDDFSALEQDAFHTWLLTYWSHCLVAACQRPASIGAPLHLYDQLVTGGGNPSTLVERLCQLLEGLQYGPALLLTLCRDLLVSWDSKRGYIKFAGIHEFCPGGDKAMVDWLNSERFFTLLLEASDTAPEIDLVSQIVGDIQAKSHKGSGPQAER